MTATTPPDWDEVRRQFLPMPAGQVNFASMAIGSTPRAVRDAIAAYRAGLDADPWGYLVKTFAAAERDVCDAASAYFGVAADGVAITTGTTLGASLLYAGLRLLPGQEILTTPHEFSGVLRIFDSRQVRQGTPVRKVPLLMSPATVTAAEILATLQQALRPNTRVLALTWVYSNSGVKLPLPAIAAWLADVNRSRPPAERVLLCVDGVHGFGVEHMSFSQLGCAAFVSGCHKWICGPRGTGIWCGTAAMWNELVALVPTSSSTARLGLGFSPGGVQAYEHQWAMRAAFDFHQWVGPARVESRIRDLASRAKTALAALPGVTLLTPMDPGLSAGIVCFGVAGWTAADAVAALAAKGQILTVSSSDDGHPGARYVRASFAMFNTEDEVDALAAAVASL